MTSVTITPNRLTSSGLLDSVAGEDGSNRLPSYTPMYVLRLNEYANGQASPIFNWNTPIVSTERAGVDQSKSIRLRTRPSNPAVLCGTNNFAGDCKEGQKNCVLTASGKWKLKLNGLVERRNLEMKYCLGEING